MDPRPGGLDDLGRGEPNAVVDDVHAGVGGARGDLLGAVRMAVEAGLADQELDPPPELQRDALDLAAQRVEARRRLPRLRRDAGRRAVFAEVRAQRVAPFPCRRAGFGGLDRGAA